MKAGPQIPASLRSQASNPPRYVAPALKGEGKCETCAYMERMKVLGMPDQYFCHRNPPQLIVVPQQTVEGIMASPASAFPSVPGEQWCGEYAPGKPEGSN